ncbi:hypothetical protein KAW80_02120 [Candidatus Babeliales bacterium]|nr:hypothetical protein [Candidatus Babeliales bacterium]
MKKKLSLFLLLLLFSAIKLNAEAKIIVKNVTNYDMDVEFKTEYIWVFKEKHTFTVKPSESGDYQGAGISIIDIWINFGPRNNRRLKHIPGRISSQTTKTYTVSESGYYVEGGNEDSSVFHWW